MLGKSFIVVVCWLSVLSSAQTADPPETHLQAVAQYEQGNFLAAAQLWESLHAQGVSDGDVYYNLANAYFKAGNKGASMAAILAARALLPRDPDVRANLAFILKAIEDKLEPKLPHTEWMVLVSWLDFWNEKEFFYATAVVFALMCLSLLCFLRWREVLIFKISSCVLIVVCLLMAAAAGIKISLRETWGAILPDTVAVYSSPSDKSASKLFELHAGAPVVIENQQRGDWLAIAISDGKKGFVKAEAVKVYY